jgi:hypothetical protein
MKRFFLIGFGILLIVYPILVWKAYLFPVVEIYDSGPTSIFLTVKLSTVGHVINSIIFLAGLAIIAKVIISFKQRESGKSVNRDA